MQLVINLIMLFLVAIALETLAYVGIGELFNKIYKSKANMPLSLGKRLFTSLKERSKLAKIIKDSSETLEPEFIEKMERTPLSVMIVLIVFILWCITGIAWYIIKFDTAITVSIMAAILIIAVIAGVNMSKKEKNSDSTAAKKCMKCKISKLTTYNTSRQQIKTLADVRLPNGSRYKMIPVVNYLMSDQREKSIDFDTHCVVYYDYLPFAKCVIDPKDLNKIKH